MRRHRAGTVLAVAAGLGTAAVLRAAHRTGRLPGGSARWERTNHRGDPVSLTEGVALAGGAGLPLLLLDPPAGCAVLLAGAAGAVDDLGGRTDVKGLRGHLGALAEGELTTGALKVLTLGVAGLGAVLWSDRARCGDGAGVGRRGVRVDSLAGAAVVAGSANLANLLDLRPGRALKVALAAAVPLLGGRAAAATTLGAGLLVLPEDLRGRTMLGDTGANALGAGIGVAAVQALPARGRWVLLAGITTLTLVSERVSFTRVIESTPVLREIDRWGRW